MEEAAGCEPTINAPQGKLLLCFCLIWLTRSDLIIHIVNQLGSLSQGRVLTYNLGTLHYSVF